jgi:hypothetical protein
MVFGKLFQLLVVGGAMMGAGATTGCSSPARAEQAADKKAADGGSGSGKSDAKAEGKSADAGTGGGVQGW